MQLILKKKKQYSAKQPLKIDQKRISGISWHELFIFSDWFDFFFSYFKEALFYASFTNVHVKKKKMVRMCIGSSLACYITWFPIQTYSCTNTSHFSWNKVYDSFPSLTRICCILEIFLVTIDTDINGFAFKK